MQIHGFVTLLTSRMFHESGATSLDLNAASSLLLNVLDIRTSMANYLRTKVKAWKRLKVNGYLFFGPFTLL
jgi:hypothetical protein